MSNRVSLFSALFLLALIPVPGPGLAWQGETGGPALGVHTIRADDALLQRTVEGGYIWLIQLLEWREIEPAPGEYFWEYADWLVRAAEYYGLELVLRLDHPPAWALTAGQELPVDVPAYTGFVRRVAERYRGRVAVYVIWNEPNLAFEWGGREPDPDGYVQVLCAAQAAIRAADAGALVISAGLAPTNHAGPSALDDRRYLRAMYAAGVAPCFDALGAHPYGFAFPPGDTYGAHDGLNVARLADLRAIMVEEGDEDKAVWATEVGWTTDPIGGDQQWLRVSEEEQARYLAGAYQHAAQEWPWLARMAVWNLSAGLTADDDRQGYSLLAEDGTPKPAYQVLAAMDRGQGGRAGARAQRVETGREVIEILAPDVAIRLSDVDTFYPHWARPHCGSIPCRRWAGQFYVPDLGAGPWELRMEIMQVEEWGNLVSINGRLLDPPAIPLRGRPDFASVWTAAAMPVSATWLQAGPNTLEIRSSPRLPVYQDRRARFESLQFRNLRLEPQVGD